MRVVPAGETFTFHIVLVGRAIEHLPIIILAWRRALAKGLGASDGTGDLLRVQDDAGQTIYSAEDGQVNTNTTSNGVSPAPTGELAPQCVTLHFQTPLRLQQNGHALAPHRLAPRSLVMAAARRGSLLAKFHGGGEPAIDWTALTAEADAITDQRQLEWRDWTRYSSKQKTTMQLGGVIGQWELRGDLTHALPWLKLGERLHVGKETVFGLGQYRLTITPPTHKPPNTEKSCEPPPQATERKEEIT